MYQLGILSKRFQPTFKLRDLVVEGSQIMSHYCMMTRELHLDSSVCHPDVPSLSALKALLIASCALKPCLETARHLGPPGKHDFVCTALMKVLSASWRKLEVNIS